ncbi:hypothetical protein [Streptomyces sp. NPDC056491]
MTYGELVRTSERRADAVSRTAAVRDPVGAIGVGRVSLAFTV